MQVKATRGVVVCREQLAADAGRRMYELGGNAIDAAIATCYVQGVVNPMSCGIGGTGELNLYIARSQEHVQINSLEGAGSRARPDIYSYIGELPMASRWAVKGNANYVGYQASVIPSFVRVTGEAHRLFGRLPWREVLAPAVELAKEGFTVSPWLAQHWDPHLQGAYDWPSGLETLTSTVECAHIYLKDGRLYQAGERLVQSDYANTLRIIAEEGPDAFYSGEIGRAIAEDFEANDGLFTYEDLQRCRATLSRPLKTTYHQYTLHGSGPIRAQVYNILEGFDLPALGHNTPAYLDIVARAFQIAHLDRSKFIADPRYTDVPVQHIISKAWAQELREQIESGEDIRNAEPGSIPYFGTAPVVTMDTEGNTFVTRHSNGNSSGVVTPGLGFLYNNHMHNFDPRPGYRNSIEAGKHPNGAVGGPLIVCKEGEPYMALSHHSRAGTSAEVQVLFNVIEFGQSLTEAVSAPRIHAEYKRRTIYIDPDFPSEIRAGLEALGTQQLIISSHLSPAVSVARRHAATGELEGAADPRGDGGLALVH